MNSEAAYADPPQTPDETDGVERWTRHFTP